MRKIKFCLVIIISVLSFPIYSADGNVAIADISLKQISTGNLFVIVRSQSDSTPVSGSIILLRKYNGPLDDAAVDSTDNSGTVIFKGTQALNVYTMTVSANGFVPIHANVTIPSTGSDTVTVNLTSLPMSGMKVVKGRAFDSESNTPLAQVKIFCSIHYGVPVIDLTLVTFTDANGYFSISGITEKCELGILEAMLTGYQKYMKKISIDGQPMLDTSKVNINMKKATTAIILNKDGQVDREKPTFSVSPEGVLHLSNIKSSGVIEVYTLNGKRIYHSVLNRNSASYSLPQTLLRKGNAYVIDIKEAGDRFVKKITLPE